MCRLPLYYDVCMNAERVMAVLGALEREGELNRQREAWEAVVLAGE